MTDTNKITLTLEPKKEEPVVEEEKIVVPIEISDKDLSEEEKKMVEEFSEERQIFVNKSMSSGTEKIKCLSLFIKQSFLRFVDDQLRLSVKVFDMAFFNKRVIIGNTADHFKSVIA